MDDKDSRERFVLVEVVEDEYLKSNRQKMIGLDNE